MAALHIAPARRQTLFFPSQYQGLLTSPVERLDVCARARDWLCSSSTASPQQRRSHYLLQILLLQTKLTLQTASAAEACEFLQVTAFD